MAGAAPTDVYQKARRGANPLPRFIMSPAGCRHFVGEVEVSLTMLMRYHASRGQSSHPVGCFGKFGPYGSRNPSTRSFDRGTKTWKKGIRTSRG
jgi:hypothetical protein